MGVLRRCCHGNQNEESLDEVQRLERNKRERRIEQLQLCITCGAICLGIYFVRQSTTCQETNPSLYDFVRFFVWFLFFLYTFLYLFCLIAFCIILRLSFLSRLAKTSNAAAKDTFDSIPLVSQESKQIEASTESVCCVCMDELIGDKPVKKMPCDHMIHAECLKTWLNVGKTCPMCRTDLDVAVREAASPV